MDLDAQEEIAELREALDHIIRLADNSRTRRLRWIAERARCAVESSGDWKALDLPKIAKVTQKERF